MAHEREIAEEQEFLDVSLSALDHMRDGARSLRDSAAVANMRGAGDLVERDVVMATALSRLDQLAIGDQPLFFGRIDYQANGSGRHLSRGSSRCFGRAPQPPRHRLARTVAEAFYRATGVEPLGLSRRRHVAIRANEVTVSKTSTSRTRTATIDLPESEVRAATEEGLVDGGLALGGPGRVAGGTRSGSHRTHGRHHRHHSRRTRPHHS